MDLDFEGKFNTLQEEYNSLSDEFEEYKQISEELRDALEADLEDEKELQEEERISAATERNRAMQLTLAIEDLKKQNQQYESRCSNLQKELDNSQEQNKQAKKTNSQY